MLRLYGRELGSVFSSKTDENSATFALGWVLDKSPAFRTTFLKKLGLKAHVSSDYEIELQSHSADTGYTDIEIICPQICHIIIEAKRGWILPSKGQMTKYASRLRKGTGRKLIVSLSAATREYARNHLLGAINGIEAKHLSWSDVQNIALDMRQKTNVWVEKFWSQELSEHLKGYVSMQNKRDNQVYVVALSKNPIKKNGTYTYIDVVEKDKRYFHPVGNHWPVVPPNYIGFRYDGRLQSIHHIDKYDVVTDLHAVNSNWFKTNEDLFVYRLGPAMRPPTVVKSGKIYRGRRVLCDIDTLLSGKFKTISDALAETKRRT